jgi:hypothetical protein
MRYLRRGFEIYKSILPFPMALVLGWDLQKTGKWNKLGTAKELASDFCLTLAWPITGPVAVKKAFSRMEFGPFYD